jgi:hypothetical protein
MVRRRRWRADGGKSPAAAITWIREAAMLKRRFLITAAAVLAAGFLATLATQAVIAALSAPPPFCWHPGVSRNIGIAEMPCP